MRPGNAKSATSFPMVGFTAAFCFTVVVFLGIGLHTFNSYQAAKTLQHRDFRLLKLCGMVTYLDEVLTMSARSAATTGDQRWEKRYRRFEPQLNAVLEELIRLAPRFQERDGAAQTDLANTRLVEMELNAFEMIRRGAREKAEALLFSEEYERQKKIYADGMEKAVNSLRARTVAGLDVQRKRTAWAVVGLIIALPALVFTWFRALGTLRRYLAERKTAEDALRESTSRLQAIISSEPECVKIIGLDGTLLDMNPAGLEMVGAQTREDVIGKPVLDLIHPEDHAKFQTFNESVAGNGPGTLGFRIVGVHGRIRWMETHSVPLRDSAGKVTSILSITRDVTDRRQAEDALRKAHEELEERVERRTAELRIANESMLLEIAERGRVEAALRRSENALAKAQEIAHLGSWEWHLDTGKEVWSDETYRLLGLEPQDVEPTYDLFQEMIHPDDRDAVAQAIEDALRGGKPYDMEFRIARSDGTERVLHSQAENLLDEAGKAIGMVGIVQDITEHKRADEALLESSATLAKMFEEQAVLLENTRDFVYRHDAEGVFNYLSPAVEQVTGYTVQEWWKHYTAYMTDNPLNEKVIEYTEETLRTGKESPPYLVEITHKEGYPVMLEVGERPYFEDGKVAGIVGVARDVTKRHRAEVALRESEQRLEAILDNTTAVIYMKDLEGRYVLVNRRFGELFETSQEKMVGRTDYEVFPKEMADAFRANDKRVLETGTQAEFEELAPHEDGPHTYISLKFPLLDSAGKPYAVCGISTDITERKRAAEELERAKAAAEAANRAKSVFLANMSHEIRTPLTAMLGAAELLAGDEAGRARSGSRGDMIVRNGRHLLALINDLLDLSRTEAGKLEIERVPAALSEIIADVQAVTEPLHQRPEVDFRFRFETPIPATIHTDPTRLKQALINLISNALKFTHIGHVWVRIRAYPDRAEPRLSIAVEDTGTGIPAADTDRIFETFTQIERRSSGVSDGVGLGLSLARSIAERLGGTIEIKTRKNHGSTFTLRVPTGPLDGVTWITPEEISMRSQRANRDLYASRHEDRLNGDVLLAEDASDTRTLIEEVLSSRGVTVTAVGDGEAAVKAASRHSFDLILMDIRMPRMDGLSATVQLRHRGCLTPIIALTASTTEADRQRILDAGFDDLWTKPLTLDHLVSEVAAYLRPASDKTARDDQGTAQLAAHVDPRGLGPSGPSPRIEAARAEFAHSLPERFARIEAAVKAGDMRRARESLHQLVGTGGIHGFMSVSNEAARLLALAKSGTLVDRSNELRTLEELVNQAKKSLAEHKATTPASPSDPE